MLRYGRMDGSTGKLLLTEEEIRQCVVRMGAQISEDYRGQALTAVGILTGCFVFMADLIRHIDPAIRLDVQFILASSYGSRTSSSGSVRIVHDLETPVEGKNILIVEDIVDTGLTLGVVRDQLVTRGARSVRIAALLDKKSRRSQAVQLDYVGFPIPDRFVVGYGLDFNQQFRNLKEVRVFDGQ